MSCGITTSLTTDSDSHTHECKAFFAILQQHTSQNYERKHLTFKQDSWWTWKMAEKCSTSIGLDHVKEPFIAGCDWRHKGIGIDRVK